MSDFNESVEGMIDGDAVPRKWSGTDRREAWRREGRIKARRRITRDEVAFLKAHSPGDIKMTLPSANQFPAIAFKKGVTDAAARTSPSSSGTALKL